MFVMFVEVSHIPGSQVLVERRLVKKNIDSVNHFMHFGDTKNLNVISINIVSEVFFSRKNPMSRH